VLISYDNSDNIWSGGSRLAIRLYKARIGYPRIGDPYDSCTNVIVLNGLDTSYKCVYDCITEDVKGEMMSNTSTNSAIHKQGYY
jgi:hypothetical protein